MFYLCGVGLAFFLDLLLLSKRKKTLPDKILAGWLFFVTLHLLLFYFRKMWLYPELLGIEMPLPLVHGPFLYLYTLALTGRQLSWKVALLQALPFLAVIVYLIPFFSLPVEQKVFVFKNEGVGYEMFIVIKSFAIIASGVLYVFLSSIVLRKHRIAIVNQFSYTEKVNLDWLQYLIYWMGVIWLLVIFTNDDWVLGAAVLFVLFIGFFGIRQAGIFHSPEIPLPDSKTEAIVTPPVEVDSIAESELPSEEEKPKYQKSGLSAEASETLHRQLAEMMRDNRPYRESELSLSDLAALLNTQSNYLSRVINEKEGKNFYDYINTLRIEEFKRIAESPESKKYTLLALAEQCGFNSKSSFNRYFKKVTGRSPSEFTSGSANSQN